MSWRLASALTFIFAAMATAVLSLIGSADTLHEEVPTVVAGWDTHAWLANHGCPAVALGERRSITSVARRTSW